MTGWTSSHLEARTGSSLTGKYSEDSIIRGNLWGKKIHPVGIKTKEKDREKEKEKQRRGRGNVCRTITKEGGQERKWCEGAPRRYTRTCAQLSHASYGVSYLGFVFRFFLGLSPSWLVCFSFPFPDAVKVPQFLLFFYFPSCAGYAFRHARTS